MAENILTEKAGRCPPGAHNELSQHYNGRMTVTKKGRACHEERCEVCGEEFIQFYAADRIHMNFHEDRQCITDPKWMRKWDGHWV